MNMQSRREPIKPHKLSDREYSEAFWNHLETHEGVIPRIYSDPKGIPTMGAGVALAVKGKGGYVLRDRREIGAEISGDQQKPYRFSEAEWKRLEEVVGLLNDSQQEGEDRRAQIKALIPPHKRGENTAANNKFGFTLPEERIKEQAMAKLPQSQERALDTIKAEASRKGWSREKTDEYIGQLKGSKEELALTSLQYNGVNSPRASAALLDGDRAALRDEIYYRSNANKLPGIAKRRRDEADMASGDPAEWSEAERAAWKRIEDSPSARAYRQNYSHVLGKTGGRDDVKPPLPGESLLNPDKSPDNSPDKKADGKPDPVSVRETPEGRAVLERIGSGLETNPRTLMLKSPGDWTEGELEQVMNYRAGLPEHSGERRAMEKAELQWFENIYGTENAKFDSTGRMIRPTPVRPIPEEPAPLTAKGGMEMAPALRRLADRMLGLADESGLPEAVKSLQRGLNLINENGDEKLKPDGDYGPKTDLAAKEMLVKQGPGKADEALALGFLAGHAGRKGAGEETESLSEFTKKMFAPLYPEGRDEAPNQAMQEGLNQLGGSYMPEDWTPLKLDGWIGPKTEEAYASMTQMAEPDEIASSFGRSLGFM